MIKLMICETKQIFLNTALVFSDPADISRHDRLVELVQSMLDLQRQLSIPGPEHERTLLTRRIEATDRQIDRLVYELYGLTEEEIELVEGGNR